VSNRLPHVDGSGRGLEDGDCIHCGDSGSLEGTECHVRLRAELDAAVRLLRGAAGWLRHIAHPAPTDAPRALVEIANAEADRIAAFLARTETKP
jgi:hypothetical protein